MSAPALVTAVIPTLNEANQIADCVRTVTWADEVIVADERVGADLAQEIGATVQAPVHRAYAVRRAHLTDIVLRPPSASLVCT